MRKTLQNLFGFELSTGLRWIIAFAIVLVLVYVLREPDVVRAISLRRASKQERSLYASWQEAH